MPSPDRASAPVPATTPASATFGVALRRLRESAGLTQEELAELAGLTAHGISALERGTRTRPYPHTVRALVAALELTDADREALIASVRPRGAPAAAGRPVAPDTDQAGTDHADPAGADPAGADPAGADPAGADPAGADPAGRADAHTRPADAPGAHPRHAGGGVAGAGMRGVPAPVTRLLGREDDVAAVLSVLRRTASRLVTLTGTGGVGKTRLAHAVADAARGDHPDGVIVVPLAGIDRTDLVLPAVGRALGVQAVESHDADAHVLQVLGGLRVLLVLDNLEHLDSVATVVSRVLAECPGVVVLATSRAPLRVQGESEYRVQPLPVPDGTVRDMADVEHAPAGRLLVERARAVAPAFGTRPGDHLAVAALCVRLAGIPLALEIAAARARVLDATGLLERLDDAMTRGGASDLPARQQTMRVTLEWSYRLLGPDGQTLLRRLAIFSGGCDLEAVEAVGAGLDDVLGALERLVEHSLVNVGAGRDGRPRYTMLEPVLQHAAALLYPGEVADARTAHAEHYLALAERAAPHYEGEAQVVWLERAEQEDGNLALAVEWWLEQRDGERAGRMAWALWLYWWLRGHLLRGRRLAEAALELEQSAAVRARTALTAAAMAFAQGDMAGSADRWALADEVATATRDAAALPYTSAGRGLAALGAGDLATAETHFRRALELAEDPAPSADWVRSLTFVWLGTVHMLSGDTAGAVRSTERGLALARRRGDRLTTYVALFGLIQAAFTEGRSADARRHLREGIELSDQTGDLANLAYFLESLAVVEAMADQHARAATLLGAAEAMRERIGAAVYGYYLPDPALRTTAEDDARRALGDDGLARAMAAGQALSPQEAVALASGSH